MCCHVTVYKGTLEVEAAVVARTAVTPLCQREPPPGSTCFNNFIARSGVSVRLRNLCQVMRMIPV